MVATTIAIVSPGGDIYEGFSLVEVIKMSKTPVYTYNMGQWSSMAFYIGIAGHRRFSLPSAVFLLHDGSYGAYGSTGKVTDALEFHKQYEEEVIKEHVMGCSTMTSEEYDRCERRELYMIPPEALKHGFIDEIITDIEQLM